MIKRTLGASFKAAVAGLTHAFKTERNFRIHTVVALGMVALVLFLPLVVWERVVLVMLIGSVLVIELINTALEYMLDLLKPRFNHYVAWIKDVMAGATLLVVVIAVVCGLLILSPHFIAFLK